MRPQSLEMNPSKSTDSLFEGSLEATPAEEGVPAEEAADVEETPAEEGAPADDAADFEVDIPQLLFIIEGDIEEALEEAVGVGRQLADDEEELM